MATKEVLDKDLSVARGEAQARDIVEPELARIQGEAAANQKTLDQRAKYIVHNLHKQNETMFELATELDAEAKAALKAANAEARKLGDPDKAIQKVYAEADRLIRKATAGLERSQKRLDDIIERQRTLELGNRRQRAGVHRDIAKQRAALEAEVADATEVLKQRDAMGAKLRRTIKREEAAGRPPRLNKVDPHETRAARQAREAEWKMEDTLAELAALDARRGLGAVDTPPAAVMAEPPPAAVAPDVSAPKPRGRPKKAYTPGDNPNDVVRASNTDRYIPASKKLRKWWDNKIAEIDDLTAQAQEAYRKAGGQANPDAIKNPEVVSLAIRRNGRGQRTGRDVGAVDPSRSL